MAEEEEETAEAASRVLRFCQGEEEEDFCSIFLATFAEFSALKAKFKFWEDFIMTMPGRELMVVGSSHYYKQGRGTNCCAKWVNYSLYSLLFFFPQVDPWEPRDIFMMISSSSQWSQ